MDKWERWLELAMEIQSLAQAGLHYGHDVYDRERYQRLRAISIEMMGLKTEMDFARIERVFANETGYQTPKLDTRAAIVEQGQILLVQEKDGRWALPGGWVDVLESIRSNTLKEVREETGLRVEALRLIAVQDRNQHNPPAYAYGVCKVFILCRRLGGRFVPNSETCGFRFFSGQALPALAEEKTTAAQVRLCLEAAEDETWDVLFD